MKRVGAVALALSAFAAAGVSAQTAGAMTVTTQPDLQSCVVSGSATAFKSTAEGGGFIVTHGSELPAGVLTRTLTTGEKVGTEAGVVSFARSTNGDGTVTKLTMERAADGTVTVRDGDGNIVKPTDGVFSLRSKDGTAAVTVAGGSMAARTVDGVAIMHPTEVASTSAESAESQKYHVKRPASKTAGGKVALTENAVTASRAAMVGADGAVLAKPVECRVIVRDGGSN